MVVSPDDRGSFRDHGRENRAENLHQIVFGVYGYNPETKTQSSQGKRSKRSTNMAKQCEHVFFFFVFFGSWCYDNGIVHHEYAPPGQTVNKVLLP